MKTIIKNARIVNEGNISKSDILINGDLIQEIGQNILANGEEKIVDAKGCFLIPGVIDDQVHFREPGFS